MSAQTEARETLRNWLARQAGTQATAIGDDLPLIEQRVINSLMVLDLLLFLEKLRGEPVDPRAIEPRAFASLDAICQHFLEEA